MVVFRRLAVGVALCLAVLSTMVSASGAVTAPAWNVQMADLDRIVNSTSYNDFAKMHASHPAQYAYMDWSTDGCSAGPIGASPYHFDQACWRHDFSWRNLKRITNTTGHTEWNERNKYVADQRFYNDMKTRCNAYNFVVKPTCNAAAYTYYKAVRTQQPYASDQTLKDNPTHFRW